MSCEIHFNVLFNALDIIQQFIQSRGRQSRGAEEEDEWSEIGSVLFERVQRAAAGLRECRECAAEYHRRKRIAAHFCPVCLIAGVRDHETVTSDGTEVFRCGNSACVGDSGPPTRPAWLVPADHQ